MTDKAISSLTAASALGDTDIVPLDQGGTTKKATTVQIATHTLASNTDVAAIIALTPSNDDILQRKSGAWTNRTVAQVKTDLGLATVATSGSASDLGSGTLPAARLPNPSSSTLGGVQSAAAVSHQFLTSISTSGVPALAQPAATDISGLATSATTDTTNAANISSGVLPAARLASVIAPTDSTTQNNYNPTNLATARTINWTGTATTIITGLTSQGAGVRKTIRNATTDYLLLLPRAHTSSSAGNRWNTPKGLPAFLMPGDAITFEDNGSTGWDVVDWATQGPAMGLTVFEDFVTGGFGSFINNASGTGASVAIGTTGVTASGKFVGSVNLASGSTNTGRATLGTTTTASIVPTLSPALCVQRLQLGTATDGSNTYSVNVGFIDGTTVTDGVAYEYRWNGSAPEWSVTRWAAASATRTVSGATANSSPLWLAIFMNANWTRADYLYSTDGITWTIDANPTTGLPSNTQYTGYGACHLNSAGSPSTITAIDFLGYRIDQTR